MKTNEEFERDMAVAKAAGLMLNVRDWKITYNYHRALTQAAQALYDAGWSPPQEVDEEVDPVYVCDGCSDEFEDQSEVLDGFCYHCSGEAAYDDALNMAIDIRRGK